MRDKQIHGTKAVNLISVLMRHPGEFRDRVTMILESRLSCVRHGAPAYITTDLKTVTTRLGGILSQEPRHPLREDRFRDLELSVRDRLAVLPSDAPFRRDHNGDIVLAKICYMVVRQLRPSCVLETGVCYGITSAFILAALEENHAGELHSIDLPPLGQNGDRFVGWAVADDLRKNRWQLHRGLSRKILPRLLRRLGSIQLFVHDSLHTYGNMRFEFELAWTHMAPGAVLISDDIQGNAAFQELTRSADVSFHAAIQEFEKDSLLGIAIKRG